MINMNTNIVEYLQDVYFSQLPSAEKTEIMNLGRATPDSACLLSKEWRLFKEHNVTKPYVLVWSC